MPKLSHKICRFFGIRRRHVRKRAFRQRTDRRNGQWNKLRSPLFPDRSSRQHTGRDENNADGSRRPRPKRLLPLRQAVEQPRLADLRQPIHFLRKGAADTPRTGHRLLRLRSTVLRLRRRDVHAAGPVAGEILRHRFI